MDARRSASARSPVSLATGAGAAGFTPGSPGLGDPFFPFAGNGGYDVSNYALTLDYTPATNQLVGTAVISATRRRISRASTSTCADLHAFFEAWLYWPVKPTSW